MIVLCIVLAALFLIAILPVGGAVEYGESGFSVFAVVSFFKIKVFPLGKTEKRKKQKKKNKSEKNIKKNRADEKKPGTIDNFIKLFPAVRKTFSRFRRSLTVNELTVWYMAADPDPFKTAMFFGAASAGVGMIISPLEEIFKIKKRDIRTTVDFSGTEPRLYMNLKITFRVWQIVYISSGFIIDYLKINRTVSNKSSERGS